MNITITLQHRPVVVRLQVIRSASTMWHLTNAIEYLIMRTLLRTACMCLCVCYFLPDQINCMADVITIQMSDQNPLGKTRPDQLLLPLVTYACPVLPCNFCTLQNGTNNQSPMCIIRTVHESCSLGEGKQKTVT